MLAGKQPVLHIQLTHVTSGGCVLALTLPHMLAGEPRVRAWLLVPALRWPAGSSDACEHHRA
jgi:hypothetical protein